MSSEFDVLGIEEEKTNETDWQSQNSEVSPQGKNTGEEKEFRAVKQLPFEKERPPREWRSDERYEWIVAYKSILRKAARPFRGLTKITYMDAEDLDQIVMEVTLRCFDSYDETKNTKFSTYVYRAIINYFVSLYRAANAGKRKGDIFTSSLSDVPSVYDDEKKTPSLEPNFDFSTTDTLRVYINDVETHACNTLLLEEINRLLQRHFASEDRSIFLRVISGESQLDVAASLHVPQATVSTVVRRVRTRLLTYMKYSKKLTW